MKKYKKILEMNSELNEERELYILFQDEEIDKLTFNNLVAKCLVLFLTAFCSALVSVIVYII